MKERKNGFYDDKRLEAWGGNDDWDFEFEPEILRQQPVKVPPAENHDDDGDDETDQR